jgi:hypothetical protein
MNKTGLCEHGREISVEQILDHLAGMFCGDK